MAIPKISELSTGMQIGIILLLGALLAVASEFLYLMPLASSNTKKQAQADQLAKDLAPLREFEQKQKVLAQENQQLEAKLATLRQIVPDEKEVDNFIRMVEGVSTASGINVRRFTAKTVVKQDYYDEVPFELEIDGPYYQVLDFFSRLGKLERIVNVSDMRIASIREGRPVGNKPYDYNLNETVVAVCTVTTFFSTEEQAPQTGKPGQPAAAAPQKK